MEKGHFAVRCSALLIRRFILSFYLASLYFQINVAEAATTLCFPLLLKLQL